MTENKEMQTEITIQDLRVMAQVIDLATQKGLFKAADIAVIGNIYNKIVEAINSNKE